MGGSREGALLADLRLSLADPRQLSEVLGSRYSTEGFALLFGVAELSLKRQPGSLQAELHCPIRIVLRFLIRHRWR